MTLALAISATLGLIFGAGLFLGAMIRGGNPSNERPMVIVRRSVVVRFAGRGRGVVLDEVV